MTSTKLLNLAEVQVALRLAGLPPGPLSPFANIQPPATIDQSVRSTLQAKGVLNGAGIADEWRAAFKTLVAPTHRATVYLGSAERWEAGVYFAGPGGITGFALADADYQIKPAYTHSAI